MKPTQLILAASLIVASSASAAINIDTVLVGDADNANDTTGFGGVGYDYHIGTYEVTNSQYTVFLNATAATDTYSLYNTGMGLSTHGGINQAGSSGSYTYSVKTGFENKPVNFVSFWDAARFTNWMTSGDTENGVYVLTLTGISNNTIIRKNSAWSDGGVAIASENEWYKAAYYDGDGGYTLYPTQSDTISTLDANYGGIVGTVTDVGTYTGSASHYGTFDQGGNVAEWNDAIVTTTARGLRGVSYAFPEIGLQSSYSINSATGNESESIGFRVSSLEAIPEPSSALLIGLGAIALATLRRRID